MNINFDIVGKRKIWYLISLIIIIPGMISFLFRGLNLGIDFTGGNLIQIQFKQDVSSSQIRNVVSKFVEQTPDISESQKNNYIIRTVTISEEKSKELFQTMTKELGEYSILRNENVGPVIGHELTMNAFYSLIIASILMVIYISFRFELKFGIAGVIALLHDVLVLIGIFSLFQIEVDSTFVAAILTIIGYSINDTIVIFDRIRENKKINSKEDIETLANKSIIQTLTRSINTVLTTIFSLIALLVFGGATTKVFALALLIGIISGCYSSIFNASPLWIDLTKWSDRRNKLAKA
ncbi:MAG: protein translocase subunit SecF [Bacillota bacterium]